MARSLLHPQQQGEECLGAVLEDGHQQRVIQLVATDLERVLCGTGEVAYNVCDHHPQMGQFYYSAKAFDVLERLDPDPEYWEGKRGACVGVFQQVLAREQSMDALRDVVSMLRNTMNPQVEYIVRVMNKYIDSGRH